MIDLHGFPGVDKGKDGGREWILNTSHQNRSIEALEVLTTEFVKEEYEHAVTAIIVAHQPLPLSREERQKLSEYTYNAYGNIRNISSGGDSITVMFSDAGLGVLHWNGFMPYPDYENVALDYVR